MRQEKLEQYTQSNVSSNQTHFYKLLQLKQHIFNSMPLHYVWSTQSNWPFGEEAHFWSVLLDSVGLWLADKISCLVCPITIQLYSAEQTKNIPPRRKAIYSAYTEHSVDLTFVWFFNLYDEFFIWVKVENNQE